MKLKSKDCKNKLSDADKKVLDLQKATAQRQFLQNKTDLIEALSPFAGQRVTIESVINCTNADWRSGDHQPRGCNRCLGRIFGARSDLYI
jgi:hypothetical protein